jgi:subtilisin family serine protease
MKLLFALFILFSLNLYSQTTNRQVIIKFNYAYLDFNIVDNKYYFTFPVKQILKSSAKEYLLKMENEFPGFSDWELTKIFSLTTKDTVSISRLGEKVTIPPFWAAFTLNVPESVSIQKVIVQLDHLSPIIEYCHYNFPAEFSGAPNDSLYPKQISLSGSSAFPNAGINIEDAWEIETGKSFIKVGVHDSGIDTLHPDLEVIFGGAYLLPDNSTDYGWGEDTKNHGTPVAGIIGAKRNNTTGVAGIAGGDTTVGSGCSLIDLRVNYYNQSLASFICASVVDAARSVGSYWNYPDNYYDSSYFNNTPGFGIHIGNHSYVIKTDAPLPQNPIVGGPRSVNNTHESMSEDYYQKKRIFGNESQKEVNDSIVVNTPVCELCREAYLFSYKNEVINVVSRGNSHHFSPSTDPTLIDYNYPQSFPDNWIISVGASGYDGLTVQQGLNQSAIEASTDYWSMYGGNMDLIAPGSDTIVFTTNVINNLTESYPYEKFNGTSAAAPHVSGVVALLLSHYNMPFCFSNRNLAIEDVEYILEHSATNLYGPGYDDTTGWGRLDAYKALKMIENSTLQIIHPDSLLYSQVVSSDTIALSYWDAFVPDGWGPISSIIPLENRKFYQVERVLIENQYSFGEYMQSSTQILDIWKRESGSNSIEYYNDNDSTYGGPPIGWQPIFDKFQNTPFVELYEIDLTNFKVKTRGYFYHFIGRFNEINFPFLEINPEYPTDVWFPANPILDTAKMLFSVYIQDTMLTSYYDFPCDSINEIYDANLGIQEFDAKNTSINLFPNPTEEYFILTCNENHIISKIEVCDINGKVLLSQQPNMNQVKIDVTEFQQGTYLVRCLDEVNFTTLKLLKL